MKKEKLSILDVFNIPEILDKTQELTLVNKITINLSHLFNEIRLYIKNTFYGIKNIVYYFPVIWKDRQWDFEYYFLELLKYKLISTRNYFKKNSTIIQENKQYIKEIDLLLQKIQDYKFVDTKFEEENQDLLEKIKNCINDSERNKLLKIYYTKAQMYEINLYNNIIDYLKDNCRKWWD